MESVIPTIVNMLVGNQNTTGGLSLPATGQLLDLVDGVSLQLALSTPVGTTVSVRTEIFFIESAKLESVALPSTTLGGGAVKVPAGVFSNLAEIPGEVLTTRNIQI